MLQSRSDCPIFQALLWKTKIYNLKMWSAASVVSSVVLGMVFVFLVILIMCPMKVSDFFPSYQDGLLSFVAKCGTSSIIFSVTTLCPKCFHCQQEKQVAKKKLSQSSHAKADSTDRFAVFQQRKIAMMNAAKRSVP